MHIERDRVREKEAGRGNGREGDGSKGYMSSSSLIEDLDRSETPTHFVCAI